MAKITQQWNNTDEEILRLLYEYLDKEKDRKKLELAEELYSRYSEKIDKEIEAPDYEELKTKLSNTEDDYERLEISVKEKEEQIDALEDEVKELKKELRALNKIKAQAKVLDLNNLHKLNEDLKNEERR